MRSFTDTITNRTGVRTRTLHSCVLLRHAVQITLKHNWKHVFLGKFVTALVKRFCDFMKPELSLLYFQVLNFQACLIQSASLYPMSLRRSLLLSSHLRTELLEVYESPIPPAFYILAQLIMIPTILRQSLCMSHRHISAFIHIKLKAAHYKLVHAPTGSTESCCCTSVLVTLREKQVDCC
jgi:hypothetical protein